MSRTSRITTLLLAITAAVVMPATAALAYVQPPQPADSGASTTFVGPTVTHTTQSGLSAWMVLIIAVAAVAVGVALAEGFRSLRRRHSHHLAAA